MLTKACLMQRYKAAQVQAPTAEQSQNFLKRETPFLCNVRFRCDLPEVNSEETFSLICLHYEALC